MFHVLWTFLLEMGATSGEITPDVAGPYCVAATEVFSPGAVAGEVLIPGAVAGQGDC